MSVWTLYEVFVRSKHGLNHKHVGSVHAADAAMAIEMPASCTPAAARASACG